MNSLAMLESAMVARAALRIARERKNGSISDQGNNSSARSVAGRVPGHDGRFGVRRTHKASSAEAILRHCLRQRGWSRQWRDGQLTGKQSLSLLEDIRQYGRAWLRHEAEAFFDHYGVDDGDVRQLAESSVLPREIRDSGEAVGHIQRSDNLVHNLDSQERGIAGRATSAISRFFDRAKQFARELIFSGYMAMKGPAAIAADEGAMLENQARIQAQFFDKFEREVRANPPIEIADLQSQTIIIGPAPMTPGQFVARAEQYGNAVWQPSVNADRASMVQAGVMVEERRVLGKAEHCDDCPPLAALGWQPIGSLPALGDTECNGYCHCHFEYRDANGKPPKTIKKPTVYQHRPDRPLDPAASKLPGGPGPGERPHKPTKGKPPASEPSIVPTLEEQIQQAKEAGHTFSPGVEYEEL